MKKQRFPPVARRILALIGAVIVLAAALAVPISAYSFEEPSFYSESNLDCYRFIAQNNHEASFYDTRMFLRVYLKSSKPMRITTDIAPVTNAEDVSVTVYANDIYLTFESWASSANSMPYTVLSVAVDGKEYFKVQNVVKYDKARIETWYCGDGAYSQYKGWTSWGGFDKEFSMDLCVDPSGVVNIACEERDDQGNTTLSNADIRTIIHGLFTSVKRYRTSCYTDGYQFGYFDGQYDGYNEGYTEGEKQGLIVGREQGYESGYGAGYMDGEWEGFQDGQTDALSAKGTFKDLIFGIFDAPVRLIDGMLDFDIFDINVLGLVKTLLTLGVTALILVWIFKLAK